ncbi:MAG: FtsW/RodA/SpoVE family cell cycle protein [Planctomycetes bacterium]|nr:FtsW/RodA/SpoVE family cell cycle protein [Planctomycetota bacterium]
MGRAKALASTAIRGVHAAREHQITIFERLEDLTRRARRHDPVAPAIAIFCIVLALSMIGLIVQASHAATTLPAEEFSAELKKQVLFRCAGLAVMLGAARLGPSGLRRYIPALLVVMALLLVAVFLPHIGDEKNGSNRWIDLGLVSFQPSELARIVIVLWIADRCVRLGPLVQDIKRGVAPMLALGLFFFGLVAVETDLGGAVLMLICILATMWVGGARPTHVFGTFTTVGAGAAVVAFTAIPYMRKRILMFLGHSHNQQVTDSFSAIGYGDFFGVGVGRGPARNFGVPYLESDFVFAQIGEELGFFGMLVVLGLFAALLWFGLRLVLSIKDRYDALATFGLLISTSVQAMLHVQVVAGLAPPKGMTLPFISHGGTSLIVSSIGVGLALGAARRWAGEREQVVASS